MNTVVYRPLVSIVTASVITVILLTAPSFAQVTMVEDINPGPGGTYVFRAGALGFALYFNAYDGVHGEELWVSDGTAAGTYLVKDIWPSTEPDGTAAFSSKPEHFTAAPSGMYFGASHREDPDNPPFHDYNLWYSNGQVGNAAQVPGFSLALSTSLPDAEVMGGSLYVAGWDETDGIELWKVSGTSASRITDIEPADGGSNPTDLTVVGSTVFFSADNSATSGRELWITDGTPGAESLIDIVPGVTGSNPTGITAFLGKAFFAATTDAGETELWASDGTPGGTALFKDLNTQTGGSSSPDNFVSAGSLLFFEANDGVTGEGLWATDGTPGGTLMVRLFTGAPIFSRIAFDGKLFFVTSDPVSGIELWVSDGTVGGTQLFIDVYPGTTTIGETTSPNSSMPTELTVAGDFLFFVADDAAHRQALRVTDGTAANTFMVADLFDLPTEEGPKGLTATTDRLFFQTESDLGREVHSLPTANVVSPPTAPTGTTPGSTETSETYTCTGASISLDGSAVQYRFDWDDGSFSTWIDEGAISADHAWQTPGTYSVTVEARSVLNPTITSNASDALVVTMAMDESISTPTVTGPTSGGSDISYDFVFGGTSTYDHDMEFRVDWGDGSSTSWTALDAATDTAELSHSWDHVDAFQVQVWVRCAAHTDRSNSAEHWITIEEEYMYDTTLVGPSSGWTGVTYDYTISGGSTYGHPLEYSVSWGDGTPDIPWTAFPTGQTSVVVSHSWDFVATDFPVWVGVRCALHPALENGTDMTVAISDAPLAEIFTDGFETGDTSAWGAN